MSHQKNKIWTLSFLFILIANALVFMIFEMLLPTLPLFVTNLGAGAGQIGLVTGMFMLSAILVRPFTGVLASKFNKKFLLIFGILVMALATGGYYLAENISTLLIIRLIHGAGFGLATTYFATLAAEVIPKERRGEGIGYFGVGETVAISVGPMLGILTLELYDFQRLFIGGMSILFLAVIMAFFIRRNSTKDDKEEQPTVRFKLMEKKVLVPSVLILLVGIAAGGVMSFFSLYALEKNFTQVGLFFILVAVASFLVRLISGRLFDRYGPAIVLIPASLLSMIGLNLLYLASTNTMILWAAIFYGFGFGSIFPAVQTWCIQLVEEDEHEDAMASFFNFFDFGIGGGSLLLGLIAAGTSYQTIFIFSEIVYGLFLVIFIAYHLTSRKRQMATKKSEQINQVS